MDDLPRHLPPALVANYREFPGSCLTIKFSLGIDISDKLADRVGVSAKKIGHFGLRGPHRVMAHIDREIDLSIGLGFFEASEEVELRGFPRRIRDLRYEGGSLTG